MTYSIKIFRGWDVYPLGGKNNLIRLDIISDQRNKISDGLKTYME